GARVPRPAGERGARRRDRGHARLLGPRGLRGRLHAGRAQPPRATRGARERRRAPGGTIAACATFLLIAKERRGLVLDAEDIIDGIVRGALSGRRKSWSRTGRAVRSSGLVNARTLLAAAGVAWGLFETWQGQQQTAGVSGGAVPPPTPSAPAPRPAPADPAADESGVPGPVARLLRIMISAARADGELGPAERERILKEAREVGAE